MDHPRIRGEHFRYAPSADRRQGSSPHTRGARLDGGDGRDGIRIIPAYAGSTTPRSTRRPRRRWIIPAYAGSTKGWASGPAAAWDHPRIRGEHGRPCRLRCDIPGSSPHTRGALTNDAAWSQTKRIIPAYAGSTCGCSGMSTTTRDHPRIRGEHWYGFAAGGDDGGSSPHTRGARRPRRRRRPLRRIIPAYAGSTTAQTGKDAGKRDHPRIRGEHRPRGFRSAPGPGSSPHTRGAQKLGDAMGSARGIIPAYAGSTQSLLLFH